MEGSREEEGKNDHGEKEEETKKKEGRKEREKQGGREEEKRNQKIRKRKKERGLKKGEKAKCNPDVSQSLHFPFLGMNFTTREVLASYFTSLRSSSLPSWEQGCPLMLVITDGTAPSPHT